MKLAKVLCVFLVSFFVLVTNVVALDLEYSRNSVKSKRLQASLVFSEGTNLRHFTLELANVTIEMRKSIGDENLVFQIKGISNTTGKVIMLSLKEYATISRLLASIDYSRWGKDCGHFLYSGLNLLESWPPTLHVFTAIGGGKTYYMSTQTHEIVALEDASGDYLGNLVCPEGEELESVPEAGDDLCDEKRTVVDGHVLHLGSYNSHLNEQMGWTKPFEEYIDDVDGCKGRCGVGCTRDMSDRITYTQRCFNHDECVDQCGYFAPNCNAMFFHCIEDYVAGPICYELWVSSRGE